MRTPASGVVVVVGLLGCQRSSLSNNPTPVDSGVTTAASCRSGESATAPTLPADVALRPTFTMKDGKTFGAGTAFIAEKPRVVVTALHLFGPAGGLTKQLGAAELPEKLASVTLHDIAEQTVLATASRVVLTTGRPFKGADASADVVAFSVTDNNASALALADKLPCAGSRVWAVGEEVTSSDPRQRLFAGTVRSATTRSVLVAFDGSPDFTAFSGAPVIDDARHVVGTVIAGGQEGAFLTPAVNIAALLDAASP